MTLDFCNYCFDFDMVGLTNIGNDHMDVHKSIEHYTEEVGYSNVPKPLRGIGITFIITGLMGIAFMSFLGIKL